MWLIERFRPLSSVFDALDYWHVALYAETHVSRVLSRESQGGENAVWLAYILFLFLFACSLLVCLLLVTRLLPCWSCPWETL